MKITESLRAIPQYAREHQFEMKMCAAGATASMLALKYLGKAEALGTVGLVYAAYQYRDRIGLLCQSAQNPHLLTLVATTASLPFIASVPGIGTKLVIPVAALLTLALANYDMKQRSTANGLSENNGTLKEIVGVVKATTTTTDEISGLQTKNIRDLSDLNTEMGNNTSVLKAVVESDGAAVETLKGVAAVLSELFTEIQKGQLAEDIAAASGLMQQTQALKTEVTGLERRVEQCDERLDKTNTGLTDLQRRLAAAKQRVAVLKQETATVIVQG